MSLLALAAAAGCARGVDPETAEAFQQAQKVFDKAASADDFLTAAGMYQGILDHGVVCGAVLYNQGNAFMQAGQRGRAIAAYRQAQRFRPRDPYLEANLRYALGAESLARPRRPLVEYLLFWQDWLSYPETFQLLAAAAAVTLACGIAAVFTRHRLPRRLGWAALALTLLAGASAGYDWYRYDYIVHGVITQKETIARKGNAASYEPALTDALAEGTEFRLLDRRGDWLLVHLAGGQEGWVEEKAAAVY
jgi:tetratricopeptide (TPR) repeat protein